MVEHEPALGHAVVARVRVGHEEGYQNQELGLGEAFHIHDWALREGCHQGIPVEGSLQRSPRHEMGMWGYHRVVEAFALACVVEWRREAAMRSLGVPQVVTR